uniref:FtsX-like permease family protein n=1 Tax=Allofournierella massiliensis TaxID=1650663 RepID=UPI0024B08423
MKQFGQVCAALRRKNRAHSALLAGCCFFSVLLITAYGIMMRSPTILAVLPEGGDSRKQVMMIFVLAVIGCAVFTVYASGLFFRHRSRQTGILLALGASRRQLRRQLYRELAGLTAVSCAAGALLAAPLAWGIWPLFRLFVVDSAQMALRFEPGAWGIALGFSAFVAVLLFAAGGRSVRRANIIETVQEVHRSEPIQAVPRWYGPLGLCLLAGGGLLGYLAPSVFVNGLHWYPPGGITGLFYLPALAGRYMLLPHTGVNGR